MALGTMPYRFRIVSRAPAGNASTRIVISVTNEAGTQLRVVPVEVNNSQGWDEFLKTIQEQIGLAMVQDAGGKAQFIDALIASQVLLNT